MAPSSMHTSRADSADFAGASASADSADAATRAIETNTSTSADAATGAVKTSTSTSADAAAGGFKTSTSISADTARDSAGDRVGGVGEHAALAPEDRCADLFVCMVGENVRISPAEDICDE